MMRHSKYKKLLLVVFGALLLIGGFAAFVFSNKTSSNTPGMDIQKEITLDNTKFTMVIQTNLGLWGDGDTYLTNTYQFYSSDTEPKLLQEVESLLFHSRDEKYKPDEEPYFSLKDITGDGEPEIFIQVEANGHGNRWYEILQWQYGSFENIAEEGTENDWVNFDKIEYKDGFVYMTWHGNFERGMTQYALTGNKLVRVKSVGLYTQGYNDESCDIRQINVRQDQSISTTHLGTIEDCQLWTENLDAYFDTPDTGVERAARTMQNLVPKDDTAIDLSLIHI